MSCQTMSWIDRHLRCDCQLLVFLLILATVDRATARPADATRSRDPDAAQPSAVRSDEDLEADLRQALKQERYQVAHEKALELLALRRTAAIAASDIDAPINVLTCLRTLAAISHLRGDHPEGLRWSQEALRLCEQIYPKSQFPDGHMELAHSLNNVGMAHYRCGNWSASADYFRDAVEIFSRINANSPGKEIAQSLSMVLGNQGAALEKQGENRAAANCHKCRIEICRGLLKARHADIVSSELLSALRSYGRNLRVLGDYTGATDCITEALEIQTKRSLDGDVDKSTRMNAALLSELGLSELMLGNTVAARKHLEQALAMQRQLDVSDAPHLLAEATILDGLLMVAVADCRFRDAKKIAQQIEQKVDRLYPAAQYPAGHENVASFSLNIGLAHQRLGQLGVAEQYYRKALSIWKDYFQQQQGLSGHPRIVEARYYLGNLYQETGRYDRAFASYSAALNMARQLFPEDQFPNGNELLSVVLQNMANQCWVMGETETAAQYYGEVLRMNEALYVETNQPDATHPILQHTYTAWADFLTQEQRYEEAEDYYRRALAMAEALFPCSEHPHGHPDLARSQTKLASLMLTLGDIAQAKELFTRALSCHQHLLRNEEPSAHGPIAAALCNLASAHDAAHEYGQAEDLYRQALEIYREVFSDMVFPAGHPMIAACLLRLGQSLDLAGNHQAAFNVLKEAANMECHLVASVYDGISDAQLLNIAARNLGALNHLVVAWQQSTLPASDLYAPVWRRRGLVQRLITCRQRALKPLHSEEFHDVLKEYVSIRRGLSRALFISGDKRHDANDTRMTAICELNARKEQLERQLGYHVSQQTPITAPGTSQHAQLAEHLPPQTAFVDFLQYVALEDLSSRKSDSQVRLGAFVITAEKSVKFVDLGEGTKINRLISAWRKDVQHRRVGISGHELRRRVWDPIQQILPDSTTTVYLCPDGQLSLIPWAALPFQDRAGVLLEQYAFALVPNGQMLMEMFCESPINPDDRKAALLVVGDVDYGDRPNRTSSTEGFHGVYWKRLGSSRQEAKNVVSMAPIEEIVLLTGRAASRDNVVRHLPAARWAHLATHGFFVDQRLERRLQLVAADSLTEPLQVNAARSSILGRNPFVLSGIVLSGANEPQGLDPLGLPVEPSGLLTAEAVVSLDCRKLELLVLSACETSLGDVSTGDGVFSIRDAFHIAGARNVIASLWRVDDAATGRLMADFYRLLWQDGLPPLEALRQAQLHQIAVTQVQGAAPRGPRLTNSVPLTSSKSHPTSSTADARDWAGFMLSGPGF